jgi:hypothetical protein
MVFYDSLGNSCPMINDYNSDQTIEKAYIIDSFGTCPYVSQGFNSIIYEDNGGDGKFKGPLGSDMTFFQTEQLALESGIANCGSPDSPEEELSKLIHTELLALCLLIFSTIMI